MGGAGILSSESFGWRSQVIWQLIRLPSGLLSMSEI